MPLLVAPLVLLLASSSSLLLRPAAAAHAAASTAADGADAAAAGQVLWTYRSADKDAELSTTAVSKRFFFAITAELGKAVQVTAINLKTGAKAWTYTDKKNPPQSGERAQALISHDDTLLFLSTGAALATDTGTLVWRNNDIVSNGMGSGFTLTPDGRTLLVCMGTQPRIYALQAKTGKVTWSYNDSNTSIKGVGFSSPAAVTRDSKTAYISIGLGTRTKTYALAVSSGAVVWSGKSRSGGGGQTLSADEHILFVGENAFSASGSAVSAKTGLPLPGWGNRTPSFTAFPGAMLFSQFGGTMYVNANVGHVGRNDAMIAYNVTTGEEKWSFGTWGSRVKNSPTGNHFPAQNGARTKVCVGVYSGHMYCADTRTGKVLWDTDVGYRFFGAGGTMFSKDETRVYALSQRQTGGSVGSVGLYAFDATSGKVVWFAEAPVSGQTPEWLTLSSNKKQLTVAARSWDGTDGWLVMAVRAD